jgi:hypothetical protein
MFKSFPTEAKVYIYLGLKKLISINSGQGFHNADQGHPFYVTGAKGEVFGKGVDSPETNALFKMLKELSEDLKGLGYTNHVWWYDFSTWESFCKFAVESYEKAGGEKGEV